MAGVVKTRQSGFAIDEGHYIRGVILVAAPVHRTGAEISHALVAAGISAQLDPDRIAQLGQALMIAGSALSVHSVSGSR